MTIIPWTCEKRPDTRTTNVRVGIWLFLASETMFFGSLFSAYVLLRTGAPSWPDDAAFLDPRLSAVNTALLIGATLAAGNNIVRNFTSTLLAGTFVLVKLAEYGDKLEAGLYPSTNLLLACWFTLTFMHVLHVVGGIVANTWIAATAAKAEPVTVVARLHATRLYWFFVDLVWVAILVSFYS